jgi:hypothetical protein
MTTSSKHSNCLPFVILGVLCCIYAWFTGSSSNLQHSNGDASVSSDPPPPAFQSGLAPVRLPSTRSQTVLYQAPPQQPIGIIIGLHGCSHSAEDWWSLPEDRRIVSHALSSRYVFLAPSSLNRAHKCWGMTRMQCPSTPCIVFLLFNHVHVPCFILSFPH